MISKHSKRSISVIESEGYHNEIRYSKRSKSDKETEDQYLKSQLEKLFLKVENQ